jgi:hypothetical protein
MQHLDEGTIHAWLDGALPGDEQILIEQHVRQCAECATLVADARGMIAGATRIVSALDNVPGGVIPAKRPAATPRANLWRSLRLTPFRAGLAATLMIAVASMFAIRHDPASKPGVPVVLDHVDERLAPIASPPPPAPREAVPTAAPAVQLTTTAARAGTPKHEKLEASTGPQRSASASPAAEIAAASSGAAASPPAAKDARDEMVRPDSTRLKVAAPAPTPAPTLQPSAALNEAKTRAPADSAMRAARAQDSTDAGRAVAAKRASAFAQALGSRPMQLSEVVATSTTVPPSTFVGCYRLLRDSLGPVAAVPERFALDQAVSPASTRNVVRAVNSAGSMDTVLTTATWQSNAGVAAVTWTAAREPVTLRFALLSTDRVANAAIDGGGRTLRVARLVCTQ